MKKMTRILSLLLCLTVALSMVFVVPEKSFAVNGSINAADYNKSSRGALHSTPSSSTQSSSEYTYNLTHSAGTLIIDTSYSSVDVSGSGVVRDYGARLQGAKVYTCSSAGTATLKFSYVPKNTYVQFYAYMIPSTATISANTSSYYLGKNGSGAVSTFNVTVPSKGWLEISIGNAFSSYNYSTDILTDGFKGWENLNSSRNYSTGVGVKSGTYRFQVKGLNSSYSIKTVFHPVKETSNKTSKKKAAKIKKKKSNKAIIPAGSSKAHWYKIKQPSNKKMTLVVNAGYLSNGGPSTGKLKVTVYYPNGKHESKTLYPGYKGTYKVYYGRGFTKKAARGTYYVKIKPSGGANGYFTLKWK